MQRDDFPDEIKAKMIEGGHRYIGYNDPLVPAEFALQIARQRDGLAEWKRQQMTVSQWWDEVDAKVRSHPDCIIGDSIAKSVVRFIQERDRLKEVAKELQESLNELNQVIECIGEITKVPRDEHQAAYCFKILMEVKALKNFEQRQAIKNEPYVPEYLNQGAVQRSGKHA